MKYRSDFVTNSSSSSFIFVRCGNNVLNKIIDKFKDDIESKFIKVIDTKDGCLDIDFGEIYCDFINIPHNIDKVNDTLCELFSFSTEILAKITNRDKAIKESWKELMIRKEYVEWGGDGNERFNLNKYSEKCLQDVKAETALQKKPGWITDDDIEVTEEDIENVSKEDIYEYVSDKASVKEECFIIRDGKEIYYPNEIVKIE